jgi:hypothetical protein
MVCNAMNSYSSGSCSTNSHSIQKGQQLRTQALNIQLLNTRLEPQLQQHLLILDSHQLLLLHKHQELRSQNDQLPLLNPQLPNTHIAVQAWKEEHVLPSRVSSSFHSPLGTHSNDHHGCSGRANCSSGVAGEENKKITMVAELRMLVWKYKKMFMGAGPPMQ